MENASKALEIAGGVLISVLVLGLLVFGYNKLTNLKQTQQSATEDEQATEFNKNYETYNKSGLYGSQIFSLANMVKDYNDNQSDAKGYQEMKLTVHIKYDGQFFKSKTYNESKDEHELTDEYNKLSSEISRLANKKVKEKTYKQISSMNSSTLRDFLGNNYSDYKNYTDLISEQTDVARLTFKQPTVKYDKNTGRIISMEFEQN